MNHRLSYRLQLNGGHYDLTIWVNGGCAGNLCVREEEVDVLHLITKALDGEGARGQGVGMSEKTEQ